MIICHRGIRKTVELRKLVDIIPYLLVVCMENMRTVFMYMDLLDVLRINISRNVRTLIDY